MQMLVPERRVQNKHLASKLFYTRHPVTNICPGEPYHHGKYMFSLRQELNVLNIIYFFEQVA
jgi:hypothetical protein